jgi:hypothetical protein
MIETSVVYLGNKIPRYLTYNLEYMHSMFPMCNLVFISDSEKSLSQVSKLGIRTWKFNGLNENLFSLRDHLNHDWNFRNNFWFYTFARFFAIEEYMSLNPDYRHLHIEADNLLFENFPFDFFNQLDSEIAFPMESKIAGAASVLFLRNHTAASKLARFTIDEIKRNSNITDMTILARILEDVNVDTFVLGTVPANQKSMVKEGFNDKLFCPNMGIKGFFDAMSHGQYILGIDPRNSRGLLKLNFSSDTSGADNKRFDYFYNEGKVGAVVNQEFFQLYNLHNHAKDLRLFKNESRNKLLKKRIEKSKNGEYTEVRFSIFIKMVIKAAKRRFQKVLNANIFKMFSRG